MKSEEQRDTEIRGVWIALSIPQKEYVGTASPSLCVPGAMINGDSN